MKLKEKFRLAIFPDQQRELQALRLMQRGTASMSDILGVSFGEWPPKGLDVDPARLPRHHIRLTPTGNDDVLGYVTVNDSKHLYMHKDYWMATTLPGGFGRGFNYSVLGHEATHILQHLDAGWLRTEADGFMSALRSADDKNPDHQARRKAYARLRTMRRRYNAKMQVVEPPLSDEQAKERLGYHKRGSEFQARIHETLAAGYPYWKKLPQNRLELYEGFRGFGLKPPEGVEEKLKAEPQQDFRFKITRRTRASEELRLVYDSLSPAAKEHFWEQTLPAMYGQLIEMYGDRYGRARMGLKKPVKPPRKKAPAP